MQLPAQDWLHHPATQRLIQAYESAGHPLRFVGGCVRDAVLGRLVHDIDCATPLPPHDGMALLKRENIHVIATGIDHGTITALIDGRHFEITTLRRDTACDGRHANITFTDDWKEDAARRDFTMNALYCDASGAIYDFFDGIRDAEAHQVLFIGKAQDRIAEDHLRILRFFRFNATHGRAPYDASALAACRQLAQGIATLSGERIQQEMFKLLSAPAPFDALRALVACGLAAMLLCPSTLPEDALGWLENQDNLPLDPASLALLRLSLWLRRAPLDVDSLVVRWRLSGQHRQWLKTLCNSAPLGPSDSDLSLIHALRTHGEPITSLLLLRDHAEAGLNPSVCHALLARARRLEIPTFPVFGRDLIAQGIDPGKEMGATLKNLELQWEKSGYQLTKEELLSLAIISHQ